METLHKRSSYEWGIVWMLLSATCLSLSFLFLKINLVLIDYFFLLFLRFFLPLCLVVILLIWHRAWKKLHSSTPLSLQLLRCLCVLISQYGIAFYISKSTLLNATVLLNASPLFIPLIEWVFQKHRPGRSTILSALLAFLGVLLILQPGGSLFTAFSAIGLLAALGQAGSQVLYGIRSKSEHGLTSLFYLFLFTSIVSGIVFLFGGTRLHIQLPHFEWLLFLTVLLMAIATFFNQYYRGLAYRCGRPSTLATFLYFAVFVSALLDWIVYQKTPTLLTVIGSLLIILGGILKIVLRYKILKNKKK